MNTVAHLHTYFALMLLGFGLSSPACAERHPQGRVPILLQLKWKHQWQFAGYYMAAEKGYYREAGLDVTFREIGENETPVGLVVNGLTPYGVSDSELVIRRAKGAPVVCL